jgi:hypothetical protein
MTCVELQESLAEIEDAGAIEQRAHLKSCLACSALVTELNLIISAAVDLRETDEPSPRVWNSIEIALRQEGLIHPPRSRHSLIPAFGSRWAWSRWMLPAAAVLLLSVGLYVRQRFTSNSTVVETIPATNSEMTIAGLNDADLMAEVSAQPAAMKTQYEDNLRRVNDYIRDAQGVVNEDPNDEEARRSLMEAYQQKALLFELAMDRSLP